MENVFNTGHRTNFILFSSSSEESENNSESPTNPEM